MTMPRFFQFPDQAEVGEIYQNSFAVVVPEATRNLITNPSFELNADGYTAYGSVIGLSSTTQRRGVKSLRVQAPQGSQGGVYYTPQQLLTGGTTYAFSLDICGKPGVTYRMYVTAADGTVLSGFTWIKGKGFWERASVMFTPGIYPREPSESVSPSISISPSATESRSVSPSQSRSVSPSKSSSPSLSPSPSSSVSPSVSPSVSKSVSPSRSPSASRSTSPSFPVIESESSSASLSRSPSASSSPSVSPSPSRSVSESISPSVSESPSASPSLSPSMSASGSRSPSGSASPSASVSPSHSASPSPSEGDSGYYHLCLERYDALAATHYFYTDGWQLEEKLYATTYCDGDQTGFVPGQFPYAWTGASHNSASTRSVQTRAGGREVLLSDIGFRTLAVVGLGMLPVANVAIGKSTGGAYYQNSIAQVREFYLAGAVFGTTRLELNRTRHAIEVALDPLRDMYRQPVILRYIPHNDCGEVSGEVLDIRCLYKGGLEGVFTNPTQERVALQFQMFDPHIIQDGNRAIELGFETEIPNADFSLRRTADGVWENYLAGTGPMYKVYDIIEGPDRSIYVSGHFPYGGSTCGILKIAPDGTKTYLSNGPPGGVYKLAFAPNGDLYAGGYFEAFGGNPNTHSIARYDGYNWFDVGGGFVPGEWGGSVWAIAFAANRVYYGGYFDQALFNSGGAEFYGSHMACYDLVNEVYVPLPSYPNEAVRDLMPKRNSNFGEIYVGGQFTGIYASGVSGDLIPNTQGIALYKGIVIVEAGSDEDPVIWENLGTGVHALYAQFPPNYRDYGSVSQMDYSPSGELYICGFFQSAGGLLQILPGLSPWRKTAGTKYIAKWNGQIWSPLGSGLGVEAIYAGTDVAHCLYVDADGTVYVGGRFTLASGVPISDNLAVWTGSTWMGIDVKLPGTPNVWTITKASDGSLYIGYDTPGTAYSSLVTLPEIDNTNCYPTFRIKGPGILYSITNRTTGQSLQFEGLTLVEGEELVLSLDPARITFTRVAGGSVTSSPTTTPGSTGENLLYKLRPGSNLDFTLAPGENIVSALYHESSEAGSINMTWRERYNSLDSTDINLPEF